MTDCNQNLTKRLTMIAAAVNRKAHDASASPALSNAQASALELVVYSGRINPSKLAALENVKRPAIARTISQLVAQNLVHRIENADDKRSVYLQATNEGQRAIEARRQRRTAPLERSLSNLTEIERITLDRAIHILDRVLAQ